MSLGKAKEKKIHILRFSYYSLTNYNSRYLATDNHTEIAISMWIAAGLG
jgi:hypothetical protein